jgi:hypothetical protein
MRIDLSDLDRLDCFAEALGRLFWSLMAVAFFAAILGSPGTGLLVLILGAAAFVVRAGLEDFIRSRREPAELTSPEPGITIRRTPQARRGATIGRPRTRPRTLRRS